VSLRWPWPRSLAGRTLLLLLATALLVYLGGVLAYSLLAREAAERSRILQIADRLDAAMNTLGELPPADRATTAHALSSPSFRTIWSPIPLVDDASAGDPSLHNLRRRLIGHTPELAGRAIHLRWDDHVLSGSHSILLGAAELADHSYVIFSAANLPAAIPSLPSVLLDVSFVFVSIIVVAIFLLYNINAPLRRLAEAADRYGHGRPVILPERGPREIVQVEHAFNTLQRRIRQLIADRTQALAAVSHDLRTPIARLRLRCGFIVDKDLQADCERDLAEMEAMIDATLAYLRGDEDVEQPRPTDVAAMLATLIDAAVDAGKKATLMGPRHAVLRLRALSIKRAVANLIDNAITYGGCTRVALEQTSRGLRITIDDDGPGIPDSDIPTVFEPFQRLENSRNRGTGGVGLGLTIARQASAPRCSCRRIAIAPGARRRIADIVCHVPDTPVQTSPTTLSRLRSSARTSASEGNDACTSSIREPGDRPAARGSRG
jgi:signal transduction histidine kinase